MSKLKADIELLNQSTNNFNQAYEQSTDIANEINVVLGELSSTWDGAACDEFLARLRVQQFTLSNIKIVIKELKKYTKNCADQMQQIDQWLDTVIGWFENIFGDLFK